LGTVRSVLPVLDGRHDAAVAGTTELRRFPVGVVRNALVDVLPPIFDRETVVSGREPPNEGEGNVTTR